jgi:AcrR family transcriptional regulator
MLECVKVLDRLGDALVSEVGGRRASPVIDGRAGVGMATLYRNFPGRGGLLEALDTEEVDAICEAAESLDAKTPGALLRAWLHRFFAYFTNKHHIASEIRAEPRYLEPILETTLDGLCPPNEGEAA